MFTDNEDDDDDFDDGKKDTGRRRRGQGGDERDRPLPPLLARVNGQIEVGWWGESAGCMYVCGLSRQTRGNRYILAVFVKLSWQTVAEWKLVYSLSVISFSIVSLAEHRRANHRSA